MSLYRVLHAVVPPVAKAVWRPRVSGLEHVPATGGVLLASNHLSFVDSVVIPVVVPRKVVFLALPGGRFEPRVVRVGESDGKSVEITDGLAAGERVVTRANFLIDSESRLRASLDALPGEEPTPAPAAAPGHAGHEHTGHGP